MLKINIILLISAVLALCESAAFVNKLGKKCGLSDSACHESVFNSAIREYAENGFPDLGIPKSDPYELKNVEYVALGLLKLILVDGTVKGDKTCKTKSFKTDIESMHAIIELVCDTFSIEGQYKIEPAASLLALASDIDIHGEGNGGLIIDKVQVNINVPFELKKLDDGEIHLKIKEDEFTVTFDVLDKVTFFGDNLFIGSQDISTVTVNILNENWKFVTTTFGQNILEVIMQFSCKHAQTFFDKIPLKDLTNDDLSSYVKS